jgi:hypothetical protein
MPPILQQDNIDHTEDTLSFKKNLPSSINFLKATGHVMHQQV